MSERSKSKILSKSVNESPKSEIILQSKFLAPTRSLSSKFASENTQESQIEHLRVVEQEERRTEFSPFAAPSGVQEVTPSTYGYAPQQSYNSHSPSSNVIRQPQSFYASAESRMMRQNICWLGFTQRIILNFGGALISSLFLYLMLCLFLKVIGLWVEGNVGENIQPVFELGRYGDRALAALSIATPSRIYCKRGSLRVTWMVSLQ
jgi:hypothetical protein